MKTMNSLLRLALVLGLLLPRVLAAAPAAAPGELADAAARGDLRDVERLILAGADPDAADGFGHTPLMYAVESGRYDLVEAILETRADPDLSTRGRRPPLSRAVVQGREDLVVLLLSRGADPNLIADVQGIPESPLSLALDRGDFALARRLVESGADPLRLADPENGGVNPLNLPVVDVPLSARLWRDWGRIADNADSPDWPVGSVHDAARRNDWFRLRELLDAGADPDASDDRGVTPLMAAAYHDSAAVVGLLLQRGADSRRIDVDGRNALSYAVAAGNAAQVRRLLELDGPPAVQEPADSRTNPIYLALVAKHPAILDALLEAGYRPIGVDPEGITLTMTAVWLADLRALDRLAALDGGITAARDDAGRSALEWCAAAFDRDRRAGREVERPDQGARLYPAARLLVRRGGRPDPDSAFVRAWSTGRNPAVAEDWRDKKPSSVPRIPGDGDLTLYRILRDEEPGL